MAREDNLYLQPPPQFNLTDSVENLIKKEIFYCKYIQNFCTYGINKHSTNHFYRFFNCMGVLTRHYCETVDGFEQQLKTHTCKGRTLYEELMYYNIQSYNTSITEMVTYTNLLTKYTKVVRPLVWKILRGESINNQLNQISEEVSPF